MKISNEPTKKILFISLCIIAMLTVALNIGSVFGWLSAMLKMLTPVIGGFCTAFILNIVMKLFEQKVFAFLGGSKRGKKILRPLSLIASLLVFIGAITIILLVIIPQVRATVQSIVEGFPAFSQRALQFIEDTLERFDITHERISEIVLGGEELMTKIGNFIKNNLNGFLKSASVIGGSLVSVIANIFLSLFIAIYLLSGKEMIINQCRRLAGAIFSDKAYNRISRVLSLSNKAFANFISGQFIEAIILGVLCFLGMLIFRFPYPAVVGVLVGVSALIPILGAWIGGGLSAVLILINNPIKALWFLVFLVVLQQLEGNFIYPRVVGRQVGLPGVWVLMAVIIGNGVYGALGALMAVPIASVVYTLLSDFTAYRSELKRKRAVMQEKTDEGQS
ncbi:MAG: AI-2E family transporter [Clostridia bacterium]|nr:AI-2E family transporter [Clostridia bacterium]